MGNYVYRSKAKPEMIKMRASLGSDIGFPTAEIFIPIHPAEFAYKESWRNDLREVERFCKPTERAWTRSGRDPHHHLYTREVDDKGKIQNAAIVYRARQASPFIDDYGDDFNQEKGWMGVVFKKNGETYFVPTEMLTDDERREAEVSNYGSVISADLKTMEVA